MNNLLHPDIICTDPDNLQFCLKISDTEFWYCEPNIYNDHLYKSGLYEKYKSNPNDLLKDATSDEDVKTFVSNRLLWLNGTVDVNDLSMSERLQCLDDYDYTWDSFDNDKDRNQIICENYFEQNPLDFRDDI